MISSAQTEKTLSNNNLSMPPLSILSQVHKNDLHFPFSGAPMTYLTDTMHNLNYSFYPFNNFERLKNPLSIDNSYPASYPNNIRYDSMNCHLPNNNEFPMIKKLLECDPLKKPTNKGKKRQLHNDAILLKKKCKETISLTSKHDSLLINRKLKSPPYQPPFLDANLRAKEFIHTNSYLSQFNNYSKNPAPSHNFMINSLFTNNIYPVKHESQDVNSKHHFVNNIKYFYPETMSNFKHELITETCNQNLDLPHLSYQNSAYTQSYMMSKENTNNVWDLPGIDTNNHTSVAIRNYASPNYDYFNGYNDSVIISPYYNYYNKVTHPIINNDYKNSHLDYHLPTLQISHKNFNNDYPAYFDNYSPGQCHFNNNARDIKHQITSAYTNSRSINHGTSLGYPYPYSSNCNTRQIQTIYPVTKPQPQEIIYPKLIPVNHSNSQVIENVPYTYNKSCTVSPKSMDKSYSLSTSFQKDKLFDTSLIRASQTFPQISHGDSLTTMNELKQTPNKALLPSGNNLDLTKDTFGNISLNNGSEWSIEPTSQYHITDSCKYRNDRSPSSKSTHSIHEDPLSPLCPDSPRHSIFTLKDKKVERFADSVKREKTSNKALKTLSSTKKCKSQILSIKEDNNVTKANISTVFSFTEYSGSEDDETVIDINKMLKCGKRFYRHLSKPTIMIHFPLHLLINSQDQNTKPSDQSWERKKAESDYTINLIENILDIAHSSVFHSKKGATYLHENKYPRHLDQYNPPSKDIKKSLMFNNSKLMVTNIQLNKSCETIVNQCDCPIDSKSILSQESYNVELKKIVPNKASGETILHTVCRRNLTDLCLYLVHGKEFKESINVKENAGYTPLHEACLSSSIDCVKILLKHGANPNCSLSDGTRPIHEAIEMDDICLVKILISFGADPTLKTYTGKNCIDYAKSNKMKKFLKKYMNLYDTYRHNIKNLSVSSDHNASISNRPYVKFVNELYNEDRSSSKDIIFEISDQPFVPACNLKINKQRLNVISLDQIMISQNYTHPDSNFCQMKNRKDIEKFYDLHPNIKNLSLAHYKEGNELVGYYVRLESDTRILLKITDICKISLS
ncbi:unnamed protein product [Gordionus sp. m RMFG-2023]|uniref:uncharacterized protein LOC135923673 isoform X2 n=1 Tax=Gordionus sp. m RMFG-2023 TaxID=3053472 RepID=UPI0030E156CD